MDELGVAAAEDAALDRLIDTAVPAPKVDRYGPEPDQLIEAWGDRSDPLVVFVHGGYFRPSIDRTHARPAATALAASGFRVVVPEYRRIPGDPFATVADIARLADHLGPAPAAWVGHSAGGCLVLQRALDEDRPPVPVLGLAPIADLVRGAQEHLGAGAIVDWIGGSPADYPDRYARLDPASRSGTDRGRQVRWLHGIRDASVPVSQSRDSGFVGRELAGAHHVDLIDPQSAHWESVLNEVRRVSGSLPPDLGADGE